MKTFKILFSRFCIDLLIMALIILISNPMTHSESDQVFADQFDGNYPYVKTFKISAYYSPLPCQEKYTTGSYEGDIRLNGSGVNSADGTPVYPGMIAAPKTYSFGTKMDISGIGLVAVHDRGGAIVPANSGRGEYDRLDIWMGYGDKGLQRALNWGKRTVDVIVYGVNSSITEEIYLPGYDKSESIANTCSYKKVETKPVKSVAPSSNSSKLSYTLQLGSAGYEVQKLQKELKILSYFRTDVTGYFGPITEHSVYKFQQSQGLVGDKESPGAGLVGPRTRDRLNEIISTREYTQKLVAEATSAKNKKILVQKDNNNTIIASSD